ncbi:uncharacterized protein LOC127853775 [Dreissena polymorpha]|uniref:Protein DP71L n=1 Tax=Dreissena polymorpha TaxID=45954 RepID=A0A9D4N8L9_DREPO|nr:uncharacterized protein LOC127853775 [Dreissena polymorpha]KAH3891050.1 hypothetical protein DPMN_015141 [Dreissena polymorpha]
MNRNSRQSQAQCRGFGGGCANNSNFHKLLRLDSVGEVTSGRKPMNLNQPIERTQNNKSNHINSTMAILQPTLFESWNSGCVASNSLTCSHQSKPFTLFKSMFLCNNNNPGRLFQYTSADITNRNTDFCSMDNSGSVNSKRARSTIDNLCSNHIQQTMVIPECQKYIPPPLRVGHDHNKPCITPYNARLLANSRKVDSSEPKLLAHSMNTQSNVCVSIDRKCSDDSKKIQISADLVKCILKENKVPDEAVGKRQQGCGPINNIDSVNKESSTSSTDWFEYNCQSKYVPIVISKDKLKSENLSKAEESKNIISQHAEKQSGIHSWFSNEFDENVQKTVNLHSSSHDCDNVDEKCFVSQNVLPIKSNSSTIREQECITELQPAVLFCRAVGKKARPSKKKRRQQQSRQKAPLVLDSHRGNEKNSEASMKLDNTVCINIHSFQFTCDSDTCSSDWSDDEGEFDEDFSSLEEDRDLGLRCNNLFTSLSILSGPCAISNACDNENSAVSSRLQAINNSWQAQNESQPTQQRQSKKQVRFAADHDLTSVHTIIAWGHAYAAARKGPWEEYARDRARFARRIEECGAVLNPILSPIHRSNVFTQRLMANDN